MNNQTLSRSDTATLRAGCCPACNQNHFLICPKMLHTETACYRRVLCLGCFREFGVAPAKYNADTEAWEDQPIAIILHYVAPARRLFDYGIITGPLPADNTPQLQLPPGKDTVSWPPAKVSPDRAAAAGITGI
jgi:hypothetical protein